MGFVLGEVCAWLAESGYGPDKSGLWFSYSRSGLALAWIGAAVLLGLCGLWLTDKRNKERKKSRGMRRILRILLLLCAFLAGFARMEQAVFTWEQVEQALPEDGSRAVFRGRVEEIGERGDYRTVTLSTKETGKVLIYEKRSQAQALSIGERILVKGKVSRFSQARNPGQFDGRKYYRAQGISAAVFADQVKAGEENLKGTISPGRNALYRLRRNFGKILDQICGEKEAGVMKAALLGEKEGMDQEWKNLYQRNGIAHLLAISGLHLSMIGMGLYQLLRKGGAGYGLAGLCAGAAVTAYGIMTGSSGSAMRALVMLLSSFLAAYLGRTYDLLSALALAALLLSWADPFLIGEAGFQLSFGAVLGIGLLGENLVRALHAEKAWQKTLLASLAVQLATAPVVFWHYFQYPAYGVLLNLIVVPLMGYVILSGLAGIGLGSIALGLGTAAVGSGHYLLLLFEKLGRIFLRIPGNQLVFGKPKWVQVAAYYLVLSVFTGFLSISGRNIEKNPDKIHKSGDTGLIEKIKRYVCGANGWRWTVFAAGYVCCFLCLYPVPENGCDIAFLDVGQGDGIVIQCGREGSREGKFPRALARRPAVIIDGGSTSDKRLGENRLEPYLKAEGIARVEAAVVSHGDEDHISGLRYILEECPDIRIACLILPEAGRGDPAYDGLIRAAEEKGTTVRYMKAGDRFTVGECSFTCLYPQKGEEIDPSDRNRQSLIIRMDYGGFHMLLTGDADREGEIKAVEWSRDSLADIQVLKAAHHGSRFSNSEELLEAVRPIWTVISYEEGNSYGHPHQETLDRLEEAGSRILKTGQQGAVLIHAEGGKCSVSCYCPRPDTG